MNKKLLALAVAGAIGAPVVAQAQNLLIYGRLYPEMVLINMRGATSPGTSVSTLVTAPTAATAKNEYDLYSVEASNSRWGIRGSESLGGGLNAIFQIEYVASVDNGGGITASRDTFVGLEGREFGTFKLGYMDTVYKTYGDNMPFFGTVSANIVSSANVLSRCGMGNNVACSFHLRRANSLRYDAPNWSGFTAAALYSPDEAKTATRNADLQSYGFKYESGPYSATVSYELHRDFFGGSRNVRPALSNANDPNARSKDDATRVSLQYDAGIHRLEFDYAWMDYRESGGATGRFADYRHDAFLIGVESRWGESAWRTAASYAQATAGSCALVGGAECNTEGLDGKQLSLGAAYYLSKRTLIFALYTKLWNGKSAVYSNASMTAATPATGADIDQIALGISHSF